jgi:two-component system NtrC family sensor kinase
LFVTGSVILLIMMLVSLGIMFQWRTILIDKEVHNAQSVANAFTVPALDAIIYAEQRELLKGDLLETYIENFLQKVNNIVYIEIYDTNNDLVARKDKLDKDSIPIGYNDPNLKTDEFHSIIYKSEKYGWILDTYAPLKIANKKWGVAKIGFDASSIRDEVKSIFFILLSLTVLISIVTLSVLYLLINKITFSLNSLVDEIDQIDFNRSEEIHLKKGKDEIGFLISRFDELLQRLKKSRDQLAIAQKQIYQSEKLASIGRLASGVAHEINNPLNGIKSCAYAIQKEPENKEQTKEYISLINEGVFYIENVIKKLLGFVRQSPQKMTSLSFNELILNVHRLLEYKLKQKNVEVKLYLDENLPTIEADSLLLQELVMNLFINSYDAINSNGKIIIKTGLKDSSNIFFSIQDNGMGIQKENAEKIFDPFYTTKDPGEGTGLGLWVSLGIVENHNGKIILESDPNKETTFTVILPIEVNDENNAG